MLKLREGEYLPDVGIDYPESDPYVGLVHYEKLRDFKFDESYPFLDDSLWFKLHQAGDYFLCFVILRIANAVKFGIRFRGRDVLRRYRREFRKGIVSICNHCYPWDGAAVAQALRHRLWLPMLSEHFNGPEYYHLKYFGGIPLADGSFGAQKKFNEAFDTINERGGWIHVFPEARNWLFYKPIRPFKRGAFTMAYKYGRPIVPLCISYRKRTGIYRLFAPPEVPLLTVTIGEPLFPDLSKPRKQEVDRLLKESHARMCSMAGILENPWPETVNE